MQNHPPQPAGSFGAPPPAKQGLSKGCVIAIVGAVVAVALAAVVIAAAAGGLYWFSRRANSNTGAAGTRGTSGAGAPSADNGADAPRPTSAQAAAVAGGQAAAWEQQEISWTVPQRWSKTETGSQTLVWRSPGSWDAASLIANVSPMSADFPAEISIRAFHQQAETRKTNGEVDEVRWLTLDGVRGVMFRESAPEDEDSPRRLQWMAYRNYKGQLQLVNVMLAARGKDFARHEDALFGVLYSTKLTK